MSRATLILPLFFFPSYLLSQGFATATQVVRLEVRSVSSLTVSGDPLPLTISTFEPGESRSSISDNSTRYSITTNRDHVRLSLSIDKPLPSGARLLARFESTAGASSGTIDLSESDAPVMAVSGIQRGHDVDQRIVYTLQADADAGAIPSQQRTITLTLTD